MECCGYSSPRSDVFPAGLRVLVVDDDPTWLKILEKMLKKCLYEVTTCGLAREALNLLRDRKDGFDIVISDVNMPDMDGFKLLEHVGLEMDLPVIMMSVDGETSRVMKGVQHGACDYLLKPIRMKELRNIWQHVFRKKIHEVRDIENHDGLEDMINGPGGHMEEVFFSCGSDLTSVKKRKDFENKHDDGECNDHLSAKKTRVIWTVDLHQKFVKAVNLIGLDKVGPKKILDLMAIPWLTRENVASHLQKYRLYLSRLHKEKELNASVSRMNPRGLSTKEDNENQRLQNLTTKQQKECTSGNSSISRNSSTMPNIDFRILEGDMECTVSKTIGEPKKSPKGENRTKFKNPFGQFDSEVNLVNTIGMQNPWNAEIPQLRLVQESNQHFLPNNGFNLVTFPASQQKNIKLECLQSKPSQTHVSAEEVKHASVNSRSQGITQLSPERSRNDLFSIPETTSNSNPSTLWNININSQRQYQIPMSNLKSEQQIINLASVTAFASWGENPQVCSFDVDSHPQDLGIETVDSLSSSIDPSCLYDSLRFDCEYPSDSVEFSLVDNGLFII